MYFCIIVSLYLCIRVSASMCIRISASMCIRLFAFMYLFVCEFLFTSPLSASGAHRVLIGCLDICYPANFTVFLCTSIVSAPAHSSVKYRKLAKTNENRRKITATFLKRQFFFALFYFFLRQSLTSFLCGGFFCCGRLPHRVRAAVVARNLSRAVSAGYCVYPARHSRAASGLARNACP